MNHLNDLLTEASTDAPPDRFDVDAMLGTARSRVRRRRAATGIAVAAVVGLGASLAVVGPGDRGEQEPAAPPQVQVLTLDDAAAAEEGRDYEVLTTFSAHSSDQEMTGDFVRGVLPDGRVVAQRYPHGIDGDTEIALIGDGGTEAVSTPGDAANYLGATADEIVFGSSTSGLWVLDLADLRWRHVLERVDLSPTQTVQPVSGLDGRIHLAAHPMAGEGARALYQVDLAGERAVAVARGGEVAAYAGRVAWTDAFDAPVGTVTLRDEEGGMTGFDPGTGDCIGKGLGLTADRVVLMTNCDDGAGDAEYSDVVTRIDVFELDGTPISRITGDGLGPVRMSDRFLTVPGSAGDVSGTHTYDLRTGRFLRVTDATSGLAGLETGAGSTVVWEEQLDGDTGATYVVARMR